jgi:hypothetical protein
MSFLSCKNADLLEGNPSDTELTDDNLTVENARNWFTKSTASSKSVAEISLFWDDAFESKLPFDKKVIIVPMMVESTLPMYRQLWIYINKDKKTTTRIVDVINEDLIGIDRKKITKLNDKKVNGMMLLRDMDKKFITGFVLKNSQIKGVITEWGLLKNGRSEASSGLVCSSSVSCYFSTASIVGHPEYGSYTQVIDCISLTTCQWQEATLLPFDSGGGGLPLDFFSTNPALVPTFVNGPCDLLTYQAQNNKEIIGLKLSDGRTLMLPFGSNNSGLSNTENFYNYPIGQRKVIIYIENGTTKIDIFTRDIFGNTIPQGTYAVLEHIHTHPNGSNQNIASSYDISFATSSNIIGPDVKKYIYNSNGKVEYNSGGEVKNPDGSPKVQSSGCN